LLGTIRGGVDIFTTRAADGKDIQVMGRLPRTLMVTSGPRAEDQHLLCPVEFRELLGHHLERSQIERRARHALDGRGWQGGQLLRSLVTSPFRPVPDGCGGGSEGRWVVAEQPSLSFAGLLRQLRAEARLTQEELAEAAGVSPRTVSDLERGINRTAHKDTAVLLADALGLAGPASGLFVAAARGRARAEDVVAAGSGSAPGAFAASATRALPRDIAAFTGRRAELDQLTGTLTAMAANGGVVGIHAIDGMAGIGKTTFAVHAAHRLAAGFPDGQFFLPLHAHTQGQRPVDPADALASLLLTAGLAAPLVPPGLQARAARWRDLVAGRRSCCCSMTRPAMSRSGRCCPAPRAAWCWSPAAVG
jgi:transcriptional regulator with XRE-family HTH domain